LAWASGLAIAPALAALIFLPQLGEKWAAGGLVAVWLLAGTGLAAFSGGAWSPLVTILTIAPALARALRLDWAAETGAAAVLCCPLAEAIAVWGEPVGALGPYPELMTVAALGFGAGLIAMGQTQTAAPEAREAAVSRRIAEVSHDLRTPLTHIIGFAELIEREIMGPAGGRNVEYAGLIRKSGGDLLELVNGLLDLSKIDAGRYELELESFDARDIVAEVVRLSSDAAAKKHLTLTTEMPDAPLMVRADPRALRRMLTNTLGNAVKFTPEGGKIALVARGEDGRLIVDTIDNGPGIPVAERDRLGQPYVRGASGASAEGAGLGLALVRAMADLHGGWLSFHDAPGGGALVRIDLPVLVATLR
jgi:signal transduction histidine kinase